MTLKTCPNCGKVYLADFPTREEAVANGGTAIQKEQHQTGICSDKCWDEFLGLLETVLWATEQIKGRELHFVNTLIEPDALLEMHDVRMVHTDVEAKQQSIHNRRHR